MGSARRPPCGAVCGERSSTLARSLCRAGSRRSWVGVGNVIHRREHAANADTFVARRTLFVIGHRSEVHRLALSAAGSRGSLGVLGPDEGHMVGTICRARASSQAGRCAGMRLQRKPGRAIDACPASMQRSRRATNCSHAESCRAKRGGGCRRIRARLPSRARRSIRLSRVPGPA